MEQKRICIGIGLIALDVILNGKATSHSLLSAGGSCGNVLTILSYFGWQSEPIARLGRNVAAGEVLHDLHRWGVRTDHISLSETGSTPIIIHRILVDKNGEPKHRFEFRDPETKDWLPQFKGITKEIAEDVAQKANTPNVLYLDRMNPGTLQLARLFKSQGSIVFFEPSSAKDDNLFAKFLSVADIVKFSHERIPDYKQRYSEIQCFLEIETHSSEGLLFRTKANNKSDEWKRVNAFPLPMVKDAAGAGDWCSSVIIDELFASGRDALLKASFLKIQKAIYLGQTYSALNCLFAGSRGLMYHYQDKNKLRLLIDGILEQQNIDEKEVTSINGIDISTSKKFADLLQVTV